MPLMPGAYGWAACQLYAEAWIVMAGNSMHNLSSLYSEVVTAVIELKNIALQTKGELLAIQQPFVWQLPSFICLFPDCP